MIYPEKNRRGVTMRRGVCLRGGVCGGGLMVARWWRRWRGVRSGCHGPPRPIMRLGVCLRSVRVRVFGVGRPWVTPEVSPLYRLRGGGYRRILMLEGCLPISGNPSGFVEACLLLTPLMDNRR